jgi:hypothetical protein
LRTQACISRRPPAASSRRPRRSLPTASPAGCFRWTLEVWDMNVSICTYRIGRLVALHGRIPAPNDREPYMVPLLAWRGPSDGPGHSLLQWVVIIYIVVYLSLLLVALACVGIAALLGVKGDDVPPSGGHWMDPKRPDPGRPPRSPLLARRLPRAPRPHQRPVRRPASRRERPSGPSTSVGAAAARIVPRRPSGTSAIRSRRCGVTSRRSSTGWSDRVGRCR